MQDQELSQDEYGKARARFIQAVQQHEMSPEEMLRMARDSQNFEQINVSSMHMQNVWWNRPMAEDFKIPSVTFTPKPSRIARLVAWLRRAFK